MKKTYFLLILFLLVACGPSDEEKQNIATITCNVIAEIKKDPAMKIKEMNTAREKISGEPYLFGVDEINESIKYGLCTNLVLDDPEYQNTLAKLKEAKQERIAKEEARKKREKAEEEARKKRERIAKEKAEEEARKKRAKAKEEARKKRVKAEEEARKEYARTLIKERDLNNFRLIVRKVQLHSDWKGKFLKVTLDEEQCKKIRYLYAKFQFLTIYGDLIEPSYGAEDLRYDNCVGLYGEEKGFLIQISEEDYNKLSKFERENRGTEKRWNDIWIFNEVSLEIQGGGFDCYQKKNYMIGICPDDFPPLKFEEFYSPLFGNVLSIKFKWVNE